jgi:hypothetical protein
VPARLSGSGGGSGISDRMSSRGDVANDEEDDFSK